MQKVVFYLFEIGKCFAPVIHDFEYDEHRLLFQPRIRRNGAE